MLKYVDTDIVFQEIPDEVTLAVNLSGCPCHCPGCHSKHLWDDGGEVLDGKAIDCLLDRQRQEVTCLSLMGGDAQPQEVDRLAHWLREHHPRLKIAWWSGRSLLSSRVSLANFDYIKLGPYIEAKGPLNKPTTNQILYKVNPKAENGIGENITKKFWKK